MLRFFATFLALFGLAVFWSAPKDVFRSCFIGAGGWVFGSFGPINMPTFEAVDREEADQGGEPSDTTIYVRHRSGVTLWMRVNSREVGYVPMVVVVALILATPASWQRRARGFLIGLVAVNAFVGLRLLTLILYWSNRDLTATDAIPSLWEKTVSAGVQFVGTGQPLSYIIPMIIWALVAVRREHVSMLFPADPIQPAKAATSPSTRPAKRSSKSKKRK